MCVSTKQVFLKTSQNSQENKILFRWNERPCAYNFIKKETAAQMISCQSFKGFIEHLRVTASVFWMGNLAERQYLASFSNDQSNHIVHLTPIINLVPGAFLHYKRKTKKRMGTDACNMYSWLKKQNHYFLEQTRMKWL